MPVPVRPLLPARESVAIALALVLAACGAPRPAPVFEGAAWTDARRCLAEASWVDDVDWAGAAIVDPEGQTVWRPWSDLPGPLAPGDALVRGVPAPACAALVRRYVSAVRTSLIDGAGHDPSASGRLLDVYASPP